MSFIKNSVLLPRLFLKNITSQVLVTNRHLSLSCTLSIDNQTNRTRRRSSIKTCVSICTNENSARYLLTPTPSPRKTVNGMHCCADARRRFSCLRIQVVNAMEDQTTQTMALSPFSVSFVSSDHQDTLSSVLTRVVFCVKFSSILLSSDRFPLLRSLTGNLEKSVNESEIH